MHLDTVQVWGCFKIKALPSGELGQCCSFHFIMELLLPFLSSPFIRVFLYPKRRIADVSVHV